MWYKVWNRFFSKFELIWSKWTIKLKILFNFAIFNWITPILTFVFSSYVFKLCHFELFTTYFKLCHFKICHYKLTSFKIFHYKLIMSFQNMTTSGSNSITVWTKRGLDFRVKFLPRLSSRPPSLLQLSRGWVRPHRQSRPRLPAAPKPVR